MTIPVELLLNEFVLDGAQAVVMEQRAVAKKWYSAYQAVDLARREPWTQLGVDSRVTGAAGVKLAESEPDPGNRVRLPRACDPDQPPRPHHHQRPTTLLARKAPPETAR